MRVVLASVVATALATPAFAQEDEYVPPAHSLTEDEGTCDEVDSEVTATGERRVKASVVRGALTVSFEPESWMEPGWAWRVETKAMLAGQRVDHVSEPHSIEAREMTEVLPAGVLGLHEKADVERYWAINLHVTVTTIDPQGLTRSDYTSEPLYLATDTNSGMLVGFNSLREHEAYTATLIPDEIQAARDEILARSGLDPAGVKWAPMSASAPAAVIEPLMSVRDEPEPPEGGPVPLPNTSEAIDQ